MKSAFRFGSLYIMKSKITKKLFLSALLVSSSQAFSLPQYCGAIGEPACGGTSCFGNTKKSKKNDICINSTFNEYYYVTTGIKNQYKGENFSCVWQGTACPPYVTYLNETQRAGFRIHSSTGLLKGASGNLLDTKSADYGHAGMRAAVFVMDVNGNIYISNSHPVGSFHHSSFLAGGPVAIAGEMQIENGVLKYYSNRSGHYQPNYKMLLQFEDQIEAMGVDLSEVTKDSYGANVTGADLLLLDN